MDKTLREYLAEDITAGELATLIVNGLREYRLPRAYISALAPGSIRYNLYSKPGRWASMEVVTYDDDSHIMFIFLDQNGEMVGKFTFWASEMIAP